MKKQGSKIKGFGLLEVLIISVLLLLAILGVNKSLKSTLFGAARSLQDDQLIQTQFNIQTILSNENACKATFAGQSFYANLETNITIKGASGQSLIEPGTVLRGVKVSSVTWLPGVQYKGVYPATVKVLLTRITEDNINTGPPLPLLTFKGNITLSGAPFPYVKSCIFSSAGTWQLVNTSKTTIQLYNDPFNYNPNYKELCLTRPLGTPDVPIPSYQMLISGYSGVNTSFIQKCYITAVCEGTDCGTGYADCPFGDSGYSYGILAQGNYWAVSASTTLRVGNNVLGVVELFLHDVSADISFPVAGFGQAYNKEVSLTLPTTMIDIIEVGRIYNFFVRLKLMRTDDINNWAMTPAEYPYVCIEDVLVSYQEYLKN